MKKMFGYQILPSSFQSKLEHRMREKNNGFMSCILQVDISKSGWRKAVSSVLKSGQICHFEIHETGCFRVYGTADLDKLLKSLEKKGRRARVLHLQFGRCSQNVYGPTLSSIKVEDYHTWPMSGEDTPCCCLM